MRAASPAERFAGARGITRLARNLTPAPS
jgi:hypothetical protein